MNSSYQNVTAHLDQIRLNQGVDALKAFFYDAVRHDKTKALDWLNEKGLRFTSLFVLRPFIRKLNLYSYLSQRNRYALELAKAILSRERSTVERLQAQDDQAVHAVLKWMLETGWMDDGISGEYEEVLETSATLLAKTYRDKTDIYIMEEMIFRRHRRGAFLHDLTWAFFELQDTESLFLVANRLRSSHPKDIDLAYELLGFIPWIRMDRSRDNMQHYYIAMQWLRENRPFICYTGESFQEKNNPAPYAISYEAKYLCSPISDDRSSTFRSLSREDSDLLTGFGKLDAATKALLANYSYMLYGQNRYWWALWRRYPIAEQVRTARMMSGGVYHG